VLRRPLSLDLREAGVLRLWSGPDPKVRPLYPPRRAAPGSADSLPNLPRMTAMNDPRQPRLVSGFLQRHGLRVAGQSPVPPRYFGGDQRRSAYTGFMSVQRDELLRLVEELPEDQVPVVLDDVRRHLSAVRGRPWPPAWFGSGEGRTADVAARSEELLGDGFGRSA